MMSETLSDVPGVRRCVTVGAATGLLWALFFVPAFFLGLTPVQGDAANLVLALITLAAVAVGLPMIRRRHYRTLRAALCLAGGALLVAVPLTAIAAAIVLCQMFSC